MSWPLLSWILSAAGAALFFGAGRLTVRPRSQSTTTARDDEEPTLTHVPTTATLAMGTPPPRTVTPAAPARTTTIDPALSVELQRLQRELAAAHGETQRLRADGQQQQAEIQRLRAESRQLQAVIDGKARAESQVERLRTALTTAESTLNEARGQLREAQERLQGAETRLRAAPAPGTTETLRQDLAIKDDQLATRAQAVRRLETENATLRQELAAQAPLTAEVDWLRAENTKLRAQVAPARNGTRGGKPMDLDGAPGVSRGSVLQTLVDRVSRLGDVRCAVVADDLGLVVASQGELSDEVAAIGALFSRAGQQAQRVLPLETVERVTVEDGLGLMLALRPLRTGQNEGDPELCLITLAAGAAPDQRQVNKLIDEGPRLALLP